MICGWRKSKTWGGRLTHPSQFWPWGQYLVFEDCCDYVSKFFTRHGPWIANCTESDTFSPTLSVSVFTISSFSNWGTSIVCSVGVPTNFRSPTGPPGVGSQSNTSTNGTPVIGPNSEKRRSPAAKKDFFFCLNFVHFCCLPGTPVARSRTSRKRQERLVNQGVRARARCQRCCRCRPRR